MSVKDTEWNKLSVCMDIPYCEQEEIRLNRSIKVKQIFEHFNERKYFGSCNPLKENLMC